MMRIGNMATCHILAVLACFLVTDNHELQAAIILSNQVDVDSITHDAHFQIEFDAAPDFLTTNGAGVPHDSFQFYIFYDGDPHQAETLSNVIIRGDEIRFDNDIKVRDTLPLGTGGANSGGWGPLRGSVPFNLVGSILTFDVPGALIGDSDENLDYKLISTRDGAFQSVIYGNPPAPEPSSIALLGLGMASWTGYAWRYRRKTQI